MNQDLDNTVDAEVQNMVNNPPIDPAGFSEDVQAFITSSMKMVLDGTIDLFKPETLLKQPEYDNANEEAQGKADLVAVNLCKKLRDIKDLMDISGGEQLFIQPTYQATLLVEDLKYRKEEFEKQWGDLFII